MKNLCYSYNINVETMNIGKQYNSYKIKYSFWSNEKHVLDTHSHYSDILFII